jgi:hypothetical protein
MWPISTCVDKPTPRFRNQILSLSGAYVATLAFMPHSGLPQGVKPLLFFEAHNVSDNVVLLIGLKNEVGHGPMWGLEENI